MYAILSDIHGNLQALEAVAKDMKDFKIDGIILLGDLIDYGMQSNEVVEFISSEWSDRIVCNIWGNHENAILRNDFSRFSSLRGEESARHTAAQLSENVRNYLFNELEQTGRYDFQIDNMRILAIHGSLEDYLWKSINPETQSEDYAVFDIVLSGHSHYSHVFTRFYDCDDELRRNKHAVRFINPGSVGQPRNHNPHAQYALFDQETLSISLRTVRYNIDVTMSLFDGSKDDFYKERLKYGV